VKYHRHLTLFLPFARQSLCATHVAIEIAEPRKSADQGDTKAWNRRLLQ
jgi:hypothetical protein